MNETSWPEGMIFNQIIDFKRPLGLGNVNKNMKLNELIDNCSSARRQRAAESFCPANNVGMLLCHDAVEQQFWQLDNIQAVKIH